MNQLWPVLCVCAFVCVGGGREGREGGGGSGGWASMVCALPRTQDFHSGKRRNRVTFAAGYEAEIDVHLHAYVAES